MSSNTSASTVKPTTSADKTAISSQEPSTDISATPSAEAESTPTVNNDAETEEELYEVDAEPEEVYQSRAPKNPGIIKGGSSGGSTVKDGGGNVKK